MGLPEERVRPAGNGKGWRYQRAEGVEIRETNDLSEMRQQQVLYFGFIVRNANAAESFDFQSTQESRRYRCELGATTPYGRALVMK